MNRTIASHISKKLSGSLSPAEHAELDNWLNAHEENREEFENLKLLWESSHHEGEVKSNGAEWLRDRIAKRIRQDQLRRALIVTGVVVTGLTAIYLLFYFMAA